MSKPTIKRGPASRHEARDERLVEFWDRDAQKGGLIAVQRNEDDTLHVSVYRCDPGVVVHVGGHRRSYHPKQLAS